MFFKKKYFSLLIIFTITYTISLIGGLVTKTFKEPWYSTIIRPSFSPPDWIFAPVWSILYLIMSIAIWRIWIRYKDKRIIKLYFIHLFFNLSWSIIFFGFHLIGFALIDLIILLIFILILMKNYFIRDKLSFILMIPYLLWSSYAMILNFSILILN